MPTYDYQCDACKHEFELYQSIKAEPEKKCPKCGKNKLRRLIGTGLAIMFKGSGFYTTDYRSESYKKSAEADKKSSAGEKSTSGEKSSSGDKTSSGDKPAAKSESSPKKESGKSKPSKDQ